MNNINFTHQLIKGKIAELIFAQMVRNTRAYTILEFGYENTLPSLAQMYPKSETSAATMEIIKRAPDFTIINHTNKEVHLVEVKYMHELNKRSVLRMSKIIEKSWKQATLFIATPSGFYFDTVSKVIKNKGEISAFRHPKINIKTQAEYIKLLNEFIRS